jgi:hypothetical protein
MKVMKCTSIELVQVDVAIVEISKRGNRRVAVQLIDRLTSLKLKEGVIRKIFPNP